MKFLLIHLNLLLFFDKVPAIPGIIIENGIGCISAKNNARLFVFLDQKK